VDFAEIGGEVFHVPGYCLIAPKPQITRGAAVDFFAQERVAGQTAKLQNGRRANGADTVFDLDVIPVNRQRQVHDGGGHKSQGAGIGLLRFEVRIAAAKLVVLHRGIAQKLLPVLAGQ